MGFGGGGGGASSTLAHNHSAGAGQGGILDDDTELLVDGVTLDLGVWVKN